MILNGLAKLKFLKWFSKEKWMTGLKIKTNNTNIFNQ
jgi:hypothetical protein